MNKIKLALTALLALAIFVSCDKRPTRYDYEIIDKMEVVDSHYNWFTGKQVVETVQLFVVKDSDGRVFKTKPSTSTYYRFNKGNKITTTQPYYPYY